MEVSEDISRVTDAFGSIHRIVLFFQMKCKAEREERRPNSKNRMHFICRYKDDFYALVREQSTTMIYLIGERRDTRDCLPQDERMDILESEGQMP